MIKCGPTDEQTYEQTWKAILTSQPNDKYDYITTVKGCKKLECNNQTDGSKMLRSKNFFLDKFIIDKIKTLSKSY